MRRIIVIAAIAAGLAGAAVPTTAGYWACAAVDRADVGVCLRDPVPDPLPRVPDVPNTPEV